MATQRTHPDHNLLPEADAARYLAMSRAWLRKRRVIGASPAYVKLGSRVAYDRRDLDTLIAAGRVDPDRFR